MSRSGSRVFSTHLSTRENGTLVSLIGVDCSALASAVVQLVLDSPGERGQGSKWEVHSCGVVCLVDDRSVHSAFLRLYSVKKAKLLWEQELYTPFRYSAPCPYFHSFPGDDCNVGLNFTDEEEAEKFLAAVQTHTDRCKARPQSLQRTWSMDSSSSRLLWEQRDRDSLNSPTDFKSGPASPASPVSKWPFNPTPNSSTGKLSAKEEPPLSTSPKAPPLTLPRPQMVDLPLAVRKGPLPPLPVHVTEGSGRERAQSMIPEINVPWPLAVPPPPSFPAPKRPDLFPDISDDGPRVRTLSGHDFPW